MGAAGWVVVVLYFCLMVGIGWWAKSRVHDARDYFTAGGRMPWWLAGISHHMSGYSAAVFVAYAAVAYTVGFALYVWWALGVVVALVIGAALFAPRWPRLRQRLGIVSPMEYLTTRYNLPAQQVLAWSGTALKLFDVAAKWAACAVLLNIFASVPIQWGVLLHRRRRPDLLHDRRAVGRRAHRPRPVRDPARRGHHHVRRGAFQARRFLLNMEHVGRAAAKPLPPVRGQLHRGVFPDLHPGRHRLLQRRHMEPGAAVHRLGQRRQGPPGSPALRRALPGLAADPVLPDVGRAASSCRTSASRTSPRPAHHAPAAGRPDRPRAARACSRTRWR